ncbi:MAG: 2-succinyl-5-enolpyruvyl-6-hydroxy-3-cyclohexene-1-carboxylic-acid synthase, partial [Muribaculaceae bacterium]|nr:2-succinyl-5-enolpyruvyl-6-hydroxy-3-cyclohexene-1-carboxylic-acid synthase [Muribaculaceae bacterium]
NALSRLASLSNFAIMHEAQANVSIGSVAKIDSALSVLSDGEKADLLPDVVITIGGSLVSRFVKKWLRSGSYVNGGRLRHWHVGCQPHSVDCFMCLEKRIEMDVTAFVSQLADVVVSSQSDYSKRWAEVVAKADALDAAYAERAPWSDYKAMSMLVPRIPEGWHLQLSNGTAVRYAQLFDYGHISRIDCNRGVSGIDGCTSTAIGAAAVTEGVTLLVTGDMSCQYDIGALAATCISPRFKMAVLNNGGGGIFRFIDATSKLDELEERFCCRVNLPLRQLADAYGFAYFRAESAAEFEQVWPQFIVESERPAILDIITPPQESAEVLKSYFSRKLSI